jgi:hypothetical protein
MMVFKVLVLGTLCRMLEELRMVFTQSLLSDFFIVMPWSYCRRDAA